MGNGDDRYYSLRLEVRAFIGVCILLATGLTTDLRAQAIAVQGGNPTLSITTAVAGGEPIPVVNVATSLRYQRRFVTQKITVATVCPSQSFILKVVATNVTSGVAQPEVTLTNGMLAVDLVRSIPWGFFNFATCILQYTASATFAQGNSADLGNDGHTVTYTIVRQ
jgi:hypothetical protein